MIRFWLRFFFWGFLTCLSICAGAQNTQFESLTIEQGLSQGMIFDLCQTRDGFLWVATKDGLNRYDGYNFKVFSNNPFEPYSISGNTATVLFEDARGWLWVGLDSKGVDVYEPSSGRFHHFPIITADSKLFDSAKISSIEEAPDGSIWFAQHGGGLWRIPIPTKWQNGIPADAPPMPAQAMPVPVSIEKNFGNDIVAESLLDLLRLSNGEMLLTTNRRQFVFDPKTLAYHPFNEHVLSMPNLNFQMPECAINDEALGGDMWFYRTIGQDDVLEFARIRQGQIKIYPNPKSRKEERWLRLARGKAGHSWLSQNNKVWDLSPGENLDMSKPTVEFDQVVTCFEHDRAGNLWVGTYGYGLRKYNPMKSSFNAGAAGESLGRIWVNRGRYFVKKLYWIYNYDPQTRQLSKTTITNKPPNDLNFRQANLLFDTNGSTWLLGSEAESTTASLLHYPPGNFEKADKKYDFTATLDFSDPMLHTRDGRLWVAATGGRLVRFDPVTEHFDYYEYGHLFGGQVKALRILALEEDAKGTIWMGTQLGLVKAIPSAKGLDFQLITADPLNRDGLNYNSIACILPTPDGKLWLGTKGGGINILDTQTGKVRHITTADGLLNNVVYGILPGSRAGEFWCSTNRGLAKIVAPKNVDGKFVITTFTAALGLQDNEFNTFSFCKNDNGELIFGGINGLNRFFPNTLRPDTTLPPVFIVNIEINHQKSAFACPENLRELEISHDQNNISFEFAALDFTDPSKNRYRYRLVGLDADWVETGNYRFAHFSHLAPGRYTLLVQGNNGESDWGEAQSLILVVHPPWYRSNWAYLCYLLLLAWGSYRAYQFQIRRVKEREQLAFEYRENERVKALEQVKANFFTNVTHEFRTPLTLIVEPLRQLLSNPNDPERAEKIRLAEGNSRKLLGLVNQLLDMAKLESGSMVLDLRRGDLGQAVRDVFETFLPLAEKHGVHLTLQGVDLTTFQMSNLEFDAGKVELVLNNLISNALKFTPAGGKVHVEWEMEYLEPETPAAMPKIQYSIRVSDTGIGIPTTALPKIFDRFYQVDGSHTRSGEGTGIGLALSKELAELMGGSIAAESEVGKGSVFTFWIPIAVSRDLVIFEKASNLRELPVALVVEDNADLRQFIKISLGADWQVVEAPDGEEGVRKAIELLPDLIISDLMMPHKDGFTLCDELKNHELTAHIPIILLTAKTTIDAKLKGLRTGADDYLTKPFNTEELLARMTNLVEARRRLRLLFGQANAAVTPLKNTSDEPATSDFLSELDRAFLEKANRVLEEHLADEQFSVDDFALKMLISRAQLYRKIKALTDQNTSDYIRRYRLNRAYRMLKSGTGRVGEVSLLVGFGNEKYFSTVFKEHFGVSPSQVAP
jgi:signal transduction histidine kinase/DNA-binding response OmpR family regulator/ligand-binding sensor domain-containing protein